MTPVSAPDLADGLGGRVTVCDVSTVYRMLDLEQLGVVRQIHIAGGPALYAPEDGGQRAYLLCEHCARLQTIDARQLDRVPAEIRRTLNYNARFTHFPLVGVCPGCASGEDHDDTLDRPAA